MAPLEVKKNKMKKGRKGDPHWPPLRTMLAIGLSLTYLIGENSWNLFFHFFENTKNAIFFDSAILGIEEVLARRVDWEGDLKMTQADTL